MKLRLAILWLLWAVIAWTLPVACAVAGEADFDDLTLGDVFDINPGTPAPDEFTSGDVTFRIISGSISGQARMIDSSHPTGGAGNGLGIGNVEIDVDFGTSIEQLAFRIGYFGGDFELVINGDPLTPPLDLDAYPIEFNGITIDLTDITLIPTGNFHGLASFEGTIDTFTMYGQEVFFDEFSFTPVPEPSTLALLSAAVFWLATAFYARRRPLHSAP